MMPLDDVLLALSKKAVWIVGLAMVNVIVWRKGIRQYVAMGD